MQNFPTSPIYTLAGFDFFGSQGADEAAKTCRSLLGVIDALSRQNKRITDYRIQLLFRADHDWHFELVIPALQWFGFEQEQDVALELARNFVATSKAKEASKDHFDRAAVPLSPDVPSRSVCKFKYASVCARPSCDFLHIAWHCQHMIPDVNGIASHICDIPVLKENVVMSVPNWTLSARRELTRELILMPTADAIATMKVAHSNHSVIQTKEFWETVQLCANKLRHGQHFTEVFRVVINFGNWETGMRSNPYLRECHPHAHLWLTADYVLSKIEPLLAGHHYPPEDYMLRDALELERVCILPAMSTEIQQVKNDMKQVKNDMKQVKNDMKQVTDDMKQVKNDIKAMSEMIAANFAKILAPKAAGLSPVTESTSETKAVSSTATSSTVSIPTPRVSRAVSKLTSIPMQPTTSSQPKAASTDMQSTAASATKQQPASARTFNARTGTYFKIRN